MIRRMEMKKCMQKLSWLLKKTKINMFIKDTKGMGTIEVILIIVVLIGLVLIFKDQITSIVESLFSKVASNANKL